MSANKIPIIYAIIYTKIRDEIKGETIGVNLIKEIIGKRLLIRTPNYFHRDIINELVEMGLLKYKNNNGIYIVCDNDCNKKIKEKMLLYC